jgi:hypothetical protein
VNGALAGVLVEVQRRIEALYALERGAPVTDFLIPQQDACVLPGSGSRTLVTQEGDEVSLGVVLEEQVGRQLERSDPRVRLDQDNLGPFCTAAEEVSHFVYLLFCASASRSVTQLELELQGEVDKYLSAAFLLSLQNDGAVSSRLRVLLFRNFRLADHLPEESVERYRPACPTWRASRGASIGSGSARSSSASRSSREAVRGGRAVNERELAAAYAEEGRRVRRLRMVVDLTSNVIMQGRLSRPEAEELIAAARVRILDLFPDKESTYELILAPRFARLMDEFARPAPARVVPFRRREESSL